MNSLNVRGSVLSERAHLVDQVLHNQPVAMWSGGQEVLGVLHAPGKDSSSPNGSSSKGSAVHGGALVKRGVICGCAKCSAEGESPKHFTFSLW